MPDRQAVERSSRLPRQPRSILFASIGVLVLGCSIGSPSDGQAGGPEDPPTPPTQGAVLQSAWNTATGTGDTAVSDGGRWPSMYCHEDIRAAVMSVVPGAPHGWTLTPNVLQITNAGEDYCALIGNTSAIPQTASEFFIRFYVMVETLRNGFTFHSIKASFNTDNTVAYWAIERPTTSSYAPRLRQNGTGVGMPPFGYMGPTLPLGQWFRFEMRVHFYDPANPLRFRVWPSIYRMDGSLLAGPEGYADVDDSRRTLAGDWAAGGYMEAATRDRARQFHLGYEGTGGNNDTGARWYYAGVEVRTDAFPGPIQ